MKYRPSVALVQSVLVEHEALRRPDAPPHSWLCCVLADELYAMREEALQLHTHATSLVALLDVLGHAEGGINVQDTNLHRRVESLRTCLASFGGR